MALNIIFNVFIYYIYLHDISSYICINICTTFLICLVSYLKSYFILSSTIVFPFSINAVLALSIEQCCLCVSWVLHRTIGKKHQWNWIKCNIIIFVSNIGDWNFQLCYSGPWFNIKMSSYQYRKSHCGDKMIFQPSYLHNGKSYTVKTSLYGIRALRSMDYQGLSLC